MNMLDLLIRRWQRMHDDSSSSDSSDSSSSESFTSNALRIGAGVDTTLYITNDNGVLTATPSPDYGGTGYHEGIRGSWVSEYPNHGVKYSTDGGRTWKDWIFENGTLDVSSLGNQISRVTKVEGRDSVTYSRQMITIDDPSSSSGVYVIDIEFEEAPFEIPTDYYSRYALTSDLKEENHSANTDWDVFKPSSTSVSYSTVGGITGATVTNGCIYNSDKGTGTGMTNGACFSIWCKCASVPASSGSAKYFANSDSVSSKGFYIGYVNGKYTASCNRGTATSNVAVDTGWHNLVANYDATNLVLDLWIDGVKVATKALPSAPDKGTGIAINSGYATNSTTPDDMPTVNVTYNNVTYFNRTLSDAEIRGLYHEFD